jgi:hypothetical protein
MATAERFERWMLAALAEVKKPQLAEFWKQTVPDSSGKVAVRLAVSEAMVNVSLLDPVPKTSWFVLLERFSVEKVGLLEVAISCGVDKVIVPDPLDTFT